MPILHSRDLQDIWHLKMDDESTVDEFLFSLPNVYISCHRHKDQKDTIQRLVDSLTSHKKLTQLEIIFDHTGPVEKVIEQTDLFVLLYTQQYGESRLKEADYADWCHKPIFVVYIDDPSKVVIEPRLANIISNAQSTFDYSKIEDKELATREFTRRVIKTVMRCRFHAINIPELPMGYRGRSNTWEDEIRRGLKRVCMTSGVLLISGHDGVGKTSLMSAFLRDSGNQRYLSVDCRIKTALWLNCYKWQNEPGFVRNDSVAISKVVKAELTRALKRHGNVKPDLFIFDDIHNPIAIEIAHSLLFLRKLAVCIITNDKVVSAMKSGKWQQFLDRGEIVHLEVPLFSDQELAAFIKTVLLPTFPSNKFTYLSQYHVRELSQHCKGLPLKALAYLNEINNRTTLKAAKLEFEKLFATLLQEDLPDSGEEVLRKISPNALITSRNSGTMRQDSPDSQTLYFICRDVPINEQYFKRKDQEVHVMTGIKRLCVDPLAKGCLLITGRQGIGKTTLISAVLRNPENNRFFLRSCNVQIAIWLNCGPMKTLETVDALLRLGLQETTRDESPKWLTLSEMVRYFEQKQNQRILFVLDNIHSPSLLIELRHECENGLFLAIMRESLPATSRNNRIEIGSMSPEQTVGMLQTIYGMKDRLGKRELNQLAIHFCNGSPLVASLVAAQFYRCRRYRKRFEEFVNNEKWTQCSNEAELLSLLFDNIFSTLYGHIRDCYLSFFLFDPHEPIIISDLMILWSRTFEEANGIIDYLVELSLITRSGGNSVSAHALYADLAIEKGMKLFRVQTLPNLRLKIATRQLPGADILELVYKLFDEDRFDILCSVLNKLANAKITNADVGSSVEPPNKLQDKHLRTPLMAAAKCGNQRLVSIINDRCPGVIKLLDDQGLSAFHYAVYGEHLESANYLHDRWQDAIDMLDGDGKCILLNAVETIRDPNIIEFLLDQRPEMIKTVNRDGRTALMISAVKGDVQISRILVRRWQKGVQLSDRSGKTALILAAEQGYVEVVKVLYSAWPASVAVADQQGDVPLMWACRSGNLDVVRFLYDLWPDGLMHVAKNGKNVLASAIDLSLIDIVSYLYQASGIQRQKTAFF